MKNFTFKLFTFLSLILLAFISNAKEWNISSANFNALGTISATTTVDGLTIYAASDKTVVVDANAKSLDGMDFTNRLKLGGAGAFTDATTPSARVLAFDVTGNTTITVMGMSSSSSENRELIIAAGDKDSVIYRFPALGTPISKGVIDYFGGPKTIYLYSATSGINLYYIKAVPYVPEEQEWNISSAAFNALGTIAATTTVDGLTIYAASDKTVVVDANNKSIDGKDFTNRLKLGGSGTFSDSITPLSRVLSFEVTGNSTITLYGMSSSSSENRELIIAAGYKDTIIARFPALGTPITKGEYNYVGGPTTIYLYSATSGINIYYLKKTKLVSSVQEIKKQEIRIYPNPANDKVFIDVNEPTDIGIYSLTGNLMVEKMVTSSREYIDVSNFVTGMYFVRSLKNGSVAQKLLIK